MVLILNHEILWYDENYYLPAVMGVCEGDAPRPPVEAPWLFETESPIYTTKERGEYYYYVILR